WMLFPGEPINLKGELHIRAARRWPTVLTPVDFQRVTGEAQFPASLADQLKDGNLPYFCNTMVSYTLRGIHTRLNILWDFEAGAGAGDSHLAIFRGSHAWVEIRQGKEENYKPELYVSPAGAEKSAVLEALRRKVAELQTRLPGIAVHDQGNRLWVSIPARYRVGHEAHFGEGATLFFRYLREPKALPAWEKANMLAKYWLTTQGVQWAQLKA